jgi:hypothetical protein
MNLRAALYRLYAALIAAKIGISSSKHGKCFLPLSCKAAVEFMLTRLF